MKPMAAVFLDRDGVINQDFGYVHRVEDFHLVPTILDALRLLKRHGFLLIVATNQSGICRGHYTEQDFKGLSQYMQLLLGQHDVAVDAILHCPHIPAAGCDCRKPLPGMLHQGAADFGLDLGRCYLIGDKVSDIEAGRSAGLSASVLLEQGCGDGPAKTAWSLASYIASTPLDAAQWIVNHANMGALSAEGLSNA